MKDPANTVRRLEALASDIFKLTLWIAALRYIIWGA